MDEMWLQFIKEMSMVQYLKNMHPRETMLNESELAISGMVTPTTQSNIHINSFLATAIYVPESVRFELTI